MESRILSRNMQEDQDPRIRCSVNSVSNHPKMSQALLEVQTGMSIKSAARKYGIPHRAFKYLITGRRKRMFPRRQMAPAGISRNHTSIATSANQNILLVPSIRNIVTQQSQSPNHTHRNQQDPLLSAVPDMYLPNPDSEEQFAVSAGQADQARLIDQSLLSGNTGQFSQQDVSSASKVINRIFLDPNFSSNFVSALNQFLQALLSDCLEFEQLVQITGNIHMSVDQIQVLEYTVDEKICKASTNTFIISNSSCLNKEEAKRNDSIGGISPASQNQFSDEQSFVVKERDVGYYYDPPVKTSDSYTPTTNEYLTDQSRANMEFVDPVYDQSYDDIDLEEFSSELFPQCSFTENEEQNKFQYDQPASQSTSSALGTDTTAVPLIVKKSPKKTKEYLCVICGKGYTTQGALKDHESVTHQGTPRYTCPQCNRGFTSKTIYEGHVDAHENRRNFMCSVCAKSFRYKINLKRHLLKVHGQEMNVEQQLRDIGIKKQKQLFECSLCQRQFPSKMLLTSHENSHDNVNTHKCDLCTKAYRYPMSLKDHKVRDHAGMGNNHHCQTCSRVFAKKFELDRHANTCGPNKKLFKCPHCSKSSAYEDNLKRHIKVFHGTDGNYECEKCSQVSVNLNDFRQHKKLCGKDQAFKCNLCSVVFMHEHNFKRHLLKLHDLSYDDYLDTAKENEKS